jgi:hypothetical protein
MPLLVRWFVPRINNQDFVLFPKLVQLFDSNAARRTGSVLRLLGRRWSWTVLDDSIGIRSPSWELQATSTANRLRVAVSK